MKIVKQNENYRVVGNEAYITVGEAATRLGIKPTNVYRDFVVLSLNPIELPVTNGKVKHLSTKDFAALVIRHAKMGNTHAIAILIKLLKLP